MAGIQRKLAAKQNTAGLAKRGSHPELKMLPLFPVLLTPLLSELGMGGGGLADAIYTNSCKGRGEQRGTFLLLAIKGKNKSGTMKIKENKQ